MNFEYTLTIIIPVYNRAEFVGRCLDSILCQNIYDLEIICVNDASTDNTENVLKKYTENYNNVHVYTNECNRGQGYSRNRGVELASGNYIWFVDSDDMVDSEAISELRKYLAENDIVYFDSVRVDERGKIFRPSGIDEQLIPISGVEFIQRGFATASSCFQVFRRTFLIEKNIRFREGYYAEDWVYGIKSLVLASRAVYLKKPFYIYIKSENSISNNERNVYAFKGLFMALSDLDEFCCSCDWDDSTCQVLIREYARLYRYVKRNYNIFHEKELDEWVNTLEENQKHLYWFVKADLFGRKFTQNMKWEILEQIKSAEAVYIFGVGDVAMEVLPVVDMLNKRVKAYIVSDYIPIGKKAYYGVPVYHLSEIKDIEKNDLIIVAVLNRYKADISKSLDAKGYSNYVLLPAIK